MRPLKMLLRLCVLLGVAFLARAEGPPPEPRTALIIGNSAYSFAPLKNPINDAEAMASALEGAGFKVIKETDADQAKMVEAIRTFGAELKRRGTARAMRATASLPVICSPWIGALPRRWSMLLSLTAAWRAFGTRARARKL